MQNYISIKGARHNILKNISLNIPRNQFIVITGVSGSGKSSLAFDTIYSEGRKRLLDGFSPYERQKAKKLDEADVDSIEGLSTTSAYSLRWRSPTRETLLLFEPGSSRAA